MERPATHCLKWWIAGLSDAGRYPPCEAVPFVFCLSKRRRVVAEKIVLSQQRLEEMDSLYNETIDMGILGMRPTRWGELVEILRGYRRAIEADVVIEVEGREISSVMSFLQWAHARYHALEDGYDSWYGDDKS